MELSLCGGRGRCPIILLVVIIPSFLSMEQPVLHVLPSALLREVLVPCSHILWLSPSHSSQPSFSMGPGGIAPQYFCCRAGRRVSTGTVGNGIQVAEGCLSGMAAISSLQTFLGFTPFSLSSGL